MAELSENFLHLEISDDLFKDVKYYISGQVHDKITSLLRSGGAEHINYFSDYVSHLIVGQKPEETDIADATEIYEVPAVTPKWVLMCASLKKIVGTKAYLYSSSPKIFSGLIFTFSQIGDDRTTLWALISYHGGILRNHFNNKVNYLVTGVTNTPKYLKALSLGPEKVKIVTPDWVMDAVKNMSLSDPVLYHPKLINWPKPPTPKESTVAITGFELENNEQQSDEKPEKTDVVDSTQALLEKLKQNLAPSLPTNSSTSDPVAPPNVVAPSFLNKTQNQAQSPRLQYQMQPTTTPQSPVSTGFQSPTSQSPRTLVHHTPNQSQPIQNPLNIDKLLSSQPPQGPRANLQPLRGQLNTSQIHQQLLQQKMQFNQQNLIQRGMRGQLTPQQQQLLQQQLAQRNQQIQNQMLQQNQQQLGQSQSTVQQNQLLGQNQLLNQQPQRPLSHMQGQLNSQQQPNMLGLQQRPLTPQQRLLLQQNQQNQFMNQQQNQNQMLNQQLNQNQQQNQGQMINQQDQNQLMHQEQDLNQQVNMNQQDQFLQQNQGQNQLNPNQQGQMIIQQNQDQISNQQQDQHMMNQQQQTLNNQQMLTSQPNIIQNQHLGQLNQQQIQQLQQLKREQQQLINQSQNQQLQSHQMVSQNQQIPNHNSVQHQQLIQNRVLQQGNQNFNQQILQQKQIFSQQQQVQTSQQQNLLNQQSLNIQQQPPFVSQSFNQQTVDNTLNQQPKLMIQPNQLNQMSVQSLNQQLTTQNLGQQLNQQQLLQQQQQNQSLGGLDQNLMVQRGIQQQQQQINSQQLNSGINQQQVIRTSFSQSNMNQQGDLISQQGTIVNQQGSLVNQQGGMVSQQGGIVNQQGGIVNQQGGIVNQQGGMINQQQVIVNPQQSPIQTQRPQPNQQLWAQQQAGQQGGQQLQGQQILQRPVGVVQQTGPQGAAPRLQWASGQQQGIPQRQFIQLDAQTHNQLQKMPPEQQALFVARLQARQRQLQSIKQQMQQRGGGQILIRGNVPPGLTAQQQVQWLQQQAKQQGIVLPPNIQQNITPGTLTPQSPQQQSPIQAAPGLSPINQSGGQQFSDPNQQQQHQLQLRQYRLQQLQLQREQAAQKNVMSQQQGSLPPQQPPTNPPALVRPILDSQQQPTTPTADSTTNAAGQVQVNSKTRSALANMLSIKLQSGGTIGQARPEVLPEPSAAGTLRMMTAQHNAAISSKPQEILALQQQHQQQRRVITGPAREVAKPTVAPMPLANQSEPPKLQFTNQKSPLPVQHRVGPFYGHNPNLKLPSDLFLLGCIFVVVEIEDFLEEKLPGWQQKIEKYGGEVEKQYCNKVTHVLCETQRHGVVMQALRDCKRCVTIRWLSDVIQRRQVLPPWTALHLPQIYLDVRPASKHLISISGFEGNTRNMVKQMIQYTGAKCTTYFSKHNTLLICAKNEGKKYNHAKKWNIPVVNVQWLTDVMLGNFSAMNQMESQTYQTYNNPPNMSFDPKLVPNMMHAWKAPINISQESYERVKRSASPVTLPKAKKQKTEHTDENENITEHLINSNYRIMFSQFEGDKLKQLEKKVRELGGTVAQDYKDFTHLVMPNLLRSHKMLFAICKNIPILTEKWIDDSHTAKDFLPETGFRLDFEEFNMKYKVNLEKTISSPCKSNLLEGKFFWVTPSVFPSKRIVCELVEIAGGVIERVRRSRAQIEATSTTAPLTYFILTTKEDLHLVADLLKNKKDKQKVVCNVELILSAILRQQFEVEPYAVTVI